MADDFSNRKLVDKCNSFFQEGSSRKDCVGFFLEGDQVGLVRPEIVKKLKKFPDVFDIVEKGGGRRQASRSVGVHVSPSLTTQRDRTEAVNSALEKLRDKRELVALQMWQDDRNIPIYKKFSAEGETLMNLQKAAAPLFGIVTYRVHLNGYTCDDEGNVSKMWVAVRAKTKATYPGMYSNMVAGVVHAEHEPWENMRLHCQEQASIDEAVLDGLSQNSMVTYCMEDERGVMPGCRFIYDMVLPEDFQPETFDGEKKHFKLLPIDKVRELLMQDKFKPDCALVILDFLTRVGLITVEADDDYLHIMEKIHAPLSTLFPSFSS
ncbi:uncharacterized protein [Littorina saxatilis]|uniref:DUF4743 domain-containing protein n=1 Tax=Littorina saxatilis TaxID=31220 RepID=A0AAN9GBG5_9CAEN